MPKKYFDNSKVIPTLYVTARNFVKLRNDLMSKIAPSDLAKFVMFDYEKCIIAPFKDLAKSKASIAALHFNSQDLAILGLLVSCFLELLGDLEDISIEDIQNTSNFIQYMLEKD